MFAPSYPVTEQLFEAVHRFEMKGPIVFFLPWSTWRSAALEVGRSQGGVLRPGVLMDGWGNVYVAHDSAVVSACDHAARHTLTIEP